MEKLKETWVGQYSSVFVQYCNKQTLLLDSRTLYEKQKNDRNINNINSDLDMLYKYLNIKREVIITGNITNHNNMNNCYIVREVVHVIMVSCIVREVVHVIMVSYIVREVVHVIMVSYEFTLFAFL
jgi:hypothetical protein